MKTIVAVFVLAVACAAQSNVSAIEEMHARALEQNPPGVSLTISTADGRSIYHLSDAIQFRMSFTSGKARVYTVETETGMNTAGLSDDLVIGAPGFPAPLHSPWDRTTIGGICCSSKRRYLRRDPRITISGVFSLAKGKPPVRLMPDLTTCCEMKPGEYVVFVQTRRVLRGWPKSEHDKYFGASEIVVTSNNVLHLTVLADPPDANP